MRDDRGKLGRVFGRWLAGALGAFALGALGLSACGGDDKSTATCQGVMVEGVCQAKCDESQCVAAGMKCVNNACAQPCTAQTDCPPGKLCYGIGGSEQFCLEAPFAKNDGGTGQYEPCAAGPDGGTADDQCDTVRGFKCLDGTCKRTGCVRHADCADVPGYCVQASSGNVADNYCTKINCGFVDGGMQTCPCTTGTDCGDDPHIACIKGECAFVGCAKHSDCADIGLCQAVKDDTGKDVLACVKGTTYPKGQFGTACPAGKNGKDCDDANGFACVGTEGDIDAYCTKTGCQADSDCATGYFCSTILTSRPPCQTACGIPGSSTTAGCVASSDIGPGKEYSCSPVDLLQRNICLKRSYCNDCQSDDDCRALANQICAKDDKGVKHCSALCDETVPNACPWGSASLCAVTDKDIGKPTCSHRFGACKGTGKSCEPCIDMKDCPGGLCFDNMSGERYCVDLSVSCDCTGLVVEQGVSCVGGGCPASPGGVTLSCYGGDEVATAKSPLYQKCLSGNINPPGPSSTPKHGCWPLQ